MEYKITTVHEMLVVCRTTSSVRVGCIYKRVDVVAVHSHNINSLHILYFNNYILSRPTIYVILARHKGLPEDDVLTLKHVGANHM